MVVVVDNDVCVDARHNTAVNPADTFTGFHLPELSPDYPTKLNLSQAKDPTSEADTLLPNLYVIVDYIQIDLCYKVQAAA